MNAHQVSILAENSLVNQGNPKASKIVKDALAILGRPARTTGTFPDWQAVEALKNALINAGYGSAISALCQWVPAQPVSMTALAGAFFSRKSQAGL